MRTAGKCSNGPAQAGAPSEATHPVEAKPCSRLAKEVECEFLNHLNGKVLLEPESNFHPPKNGPKARPKKLCSWGRLDGSGNPPLYEPFLEGRQLLMVRACAVKRALKNGPGAPLREAVPERSQCEPVAGQ
jgi:hypothetical protein